MLSEIELRTVALLELGLSPGVDQAAATALMSGMDSVDSALVIGTMIGIFGRLANQHPESARALLDEVRARALTGGS
jgi:hypothetical protein